jgi:hypothetical protein
VPKSFIRLGPLLEKCQCINCAISTTIKKKYVAIRGTKMQILWLKVEATKLLKRQNVDAATGQF